MNSQRRILPLLLFIAVFFPSPSAAAKMSIVNSKHNLSVSGPGQIKALTEKRICVFCHTPHNANPLTPLWNRQLNTVTYATYTSSTLYAGQPSQLTGPSKLCLSCHDGTIALGDVLQPAGEIRMNVSGGIPAGRPSNFGTTLSNHHPVSISQSQETDPHINKQPLPGDLLFYGGSGIVECSTCHDPHDNSNKQFMRVDSAYSGLCTLCHNISGWAGTMHNISQETWRNQTLTNPWPRTGVNTDFGWTTVQQNGCENCHNPHNAGGATPSKRLLNYQNEEGNCFPCHNGNVAWSNIDGDFSKRSGHGEAMKDPALTGLHDPTESPLRISNGHVECVDCHNPHVANSQSATPGYVSGKTSGVSGVELDGINVRNPAVYEYEICFKCHANPNAVASGFDFDPIPRVVNTACCNKERQNVNGDMSAAFQTGNPSFHPVEGPRNNSSVPSLYTYGTDPLNTTSSIMYCTDCHDSESSRSIGGGGPRGSHGSIYSPLIRQPYDTVFNAGNFALCYRCHNETSILGDNSFRKNASNLGGHSGHLGTIGSTPVNAPCSACHDPHGVPDDNGNSGSHTYLINFDMRPGYVGALSGSKYSVPVFIDNGGHSGSCTLVCHDATGKPVAHDGSAKYSYGGGAIHVGW